jgi:DNA-binding XRE family transcriptional regulator
VEDRVKHVLETFGTSQTDLAENWLHVSKGTINHWVKVSPSIELARLLGVSFDYLVGDSNEMWSNRVVKLRKSLKAFLATNLDVASPSKRFVVVVEWLSSQAPDLVTVDYLSRWLRVEGDTLRAYVDGTMTATRSTMRRLGEWCDIDVAWFDNADATYLDTYDGIIDEARQARLSSKDLRRIIENASMSVR